MLKDSKGIERGARDCTLGTRLTQFFLRESGTQGKCIKLIYSIGNRRKKLLILPRLQTKRNGTSTPSLIEAGLSMTV